MVKENKEVEVKTEKQPKINTTNKATVGIVVGIISLVAIAVVVIIIATCSLVNKSNEKELISNMEKLGSQFYEEFYYPAQEKSQKDIKAFIAKFENTGIKVNLENIAKISKVDKELVEAMVNSKTKEKCDAQQTYAVIKPKSPYGKKDYSVEVTLECGFEEKENKESKKETTTTKKVETKKEDTKKTETTKKATKTETKKTSKK